LSTCRSATTHRRKLQDTLCRNDATGLQARFSSQQQAATTAASLQAALSSAATSIEFLLDDYINKIDLDRIDMDKKWSLHLKGFPGAEYDFLREKWLDDIRRHCEERASDIERREQKVREWESGYHQIVVARRAAERLQAVLDDDVEHLREKIQEKDGGRVGYSKRIRL
jgi:hypothetical protein